MTVNVIDIVRRVAPRAHDNYLEAIRRGDALFEEHGITTPLRMAHFLAQALHETGGFRILRENMNYSAGRLVEIFGVGHHSAAVTAAKAQTLAHHPEAIAERVYGLGNGFSDRETWFDKMWLLLKDIDEPAEAWEIGEGSEGVMNHDE